jgi:hypothetical protein
MDHGDGAADVADLVGDGGDDDAGAGEELLQGVFLAIAEVLGGVDDHGGDAGAEAGLVGGEPDVGDEDAAVGAVAFALHEGAESAVAVAQVGDGGEGGQEGADGGAFEGFGGASEEAVGSLVGEQDAALTVGADDGDGAGLDEVLELLLEAAADGHLGFELAEVLGGELAAEVDLVDEGADAGEGGEVEHVAGQAGAEVPGVAVKLLGEQHAEESEEEDLIALQRAAGEEDGEEVEEAEGDFGGDLPVGDGDEGDDGADAEQEGDLAASEEEPSHAGLKAVEHVSQGISGAAGSEWSSRKIVGGVDACGVVAAAGKPQVLRLRLSQHHRERLRSG